MKASPAYRSIYRFKVFNACLLSLLMLLAPMAPLAASVNRIAATRAEQKAARALAKGPQKQVTAQEALERALFVAPPPAAPLIGATLTDAFVDTSPVSGRADPSSTVTYTAVISNTGGADAAGVTFTDTPDPNTTLVGGSVKVSPLAFADTYGTTNNTPLTVVAPGVLSNDTGTPAPTAVPIAAGPTTGGGTITLNADGSFTYTPAGAFSGPDTFTYTATNGQAPNDTATVTINVGAANTPPVANNDTASATEAGGVANGTAGTNPSGNLVTGVGAGSVADTDVEDPSSALVVVQVHTGPEGGSTGTGVVGSPLAGTYGSLTLNSNGSYTYTVDNNNSTVQALRTSGQTLQDIFNYTIQDTGSAQDTAQFTVTIAGANDNPTAVADTASATEASGTLNGTPGTDPGGNVLTNDTDVDSVANGETKTVQGVAAGNQAGPLTLNVGSGVVSINNYGTLTIAANGTYTYVVNQSNATVEALNTGGTLTDTFSYTMKDAASATSTTTITVTINGADDNPVAVADSATVLEDALATAVPVLTNDTDVDGGPKSISGVTQPANGAVVITGGGTGLTYLPNGNYCNHSPGATFDTFNYTLNGGSSTTVSMTVTCVNDPPVNTVPGPQAVADTGTLTFNTANSNLISVADVDAGAGAVKVTVSVPATKGTFVPASGSGSTIAGSGTNSVDITGTLTQVNNALNGLVYTPPAATTQAITMTVLTNDQGNTGTGGAQTDSDTITINVDQAPFVSSTSPVDLATSVGNQTDITITFSEPVTVTGAWFTISCASSGLHTAVVAGGPTVYTLNPNTDFTNGEVCTVTIDKTLVADNDTNDPPDNMAANKVFSFTIDVPPAVAPPTTPTSGATNVAASTNITIPFTESVNATTSSFTIKCPSSGAALPFTLSASPASSFTLNPVADLPAGNICQVTVIANQITDTDAGDPPDNMVADYVFSFSVPPVAVNDTYAPTIVGNVGINTANSTNFSILTNDTPNTGVTINTSGSSLNGGTVVVAADGKFSYVPAPGFEGADSFTYTITNGAGTSNSATVSLTVTGMIWFIDASAAAGNGRLATPFNTVAAFQAINTNGGGATAGNGDNIFIYQNASAYTGPITLLSNQKLIGQDATASLAAISGVSVPADSFPLPAMNLSAPATTLDRSTAGSNAVNLNGAGTANTVRGLTITTGNATSKGISGTGFGTLTALDLTISGTGPAVDLSNGTVSVTLESLSSNGSGAEGIRLDNLAGTFTANAGSIQTATNADVSISGNNVSDTVDFSYAGSITDDVGTLVSVANQNGGTKTFSGAITDGNDGDGSGISLTNNAGATINFTNTLTLSTGANPAFTATGGGTVTASAGNGTVSLVRVDAGGSGFTSVPTVGFSGGGGSGATGTASLGAASVSVTSAGSGYTYPPAVTISGGGGTGATAVATLTGGAVSAVTIVSPGSGYTSVPSVAFSSGGGSGAVANVPSLKLVAVNVTVAGSGYTSQPAVAITSGGGSGATATAILGAVNTIATTSGIALNVSNTNIGTNGMTFLSIAANGATKGITLNTTGASPFGGLTVTGTGTTNGSGGTIQSISVRGGEFINTSNLLLKNMNFINANTTDAGDAGICDDTNTSACNAAIYLSGVTTVTLDRVNISGTTADEGINALNVSNFTFSNGSATTCGTQGTTEENCFKMRQLSGSSSITNSDLSFAAEDVVEILNSSGNLFLNVNGSTFRDTQYGPPGSTGLFVRSTGTANVIFNVVNCNFLRLRSQYLTMQTLNTATGDMDVTGSTFDTGPMNVGNTSAGIGIGIVIAADNNSTARFNIINNPKIYSRKGLAVSVLGDGTSGTGGSHFEGRVNDNPDIQVQTDTINGGGVGTGIGIQVNHNAFGKVQVNNNTVTGVPNDAGITAIALAKNDGNPGGILDATITNNNVTIGDLATYNIETRSGSGSVGEVNQPVCVNVANNTIHDPSPGGQVFGGIFTWRARVANTAPNAQLNVQGFNTNIATTWAGNGNLPATGTSQSVAGGGTAIGSCTAALPPNPTITTLALFKPESNQREYLARSENPARPAVTNNPGSAPSHDSTAATALAAKLPPTAVLVRPQPSASQALASRASSKVRTQPTARAPVVSNHAVGRSGRLRAAADHSVTPLVGGNVNQSIGVLPAGKSVTITFQVTLNTAMPSGTTTVSTQGKVFYTGGPGAGVLTDDTGVPPNTGETDPTVTPIDAPTAAGSTVSGQIVDGNGNPVEGAGIRMSGTQNRLTVTDAQGFYHFDNVETNGFYTVVATRANFSFSPSQRSFSALGQTTDAAFNATANGNALNPLDTTEYFVRQQYVDFLNREPDEAGLNFWYNNIESCGNDGQCRAGKRTDTSAAFFLSTEFQQTGYLVYKSYQAAFGDLPSLPVPVRLGEFKPDTQEIGNGVVVNAPGWDTTLSANKAAFMAEFVQRSRFANAYATSLTPTEFVNKLFANAGVTPADTDRTAAVNEFGSAGTSSDVAARGRALQRVAENSMLTQQEFTQAFVLIQYFGYLRRDPNTGPDTDFSGYNFWLQKLNTFNGNFGSAEMVKSFLVSGEYRGRFPR